MTSTPEDHVTRSEGSTRTSSANESPSGSTTVHYYDNVTVSIVPEKKGLFLKHSEYEVTSGGIPLNILYLHGSSSRSPIPDQMSQTKLLRISSVQ